MKIVWLNDDFTEAVVTKGRLWWKREAIVERVAEEHSYDGHRWRFSQSRNWIGRYSYLGKLLDKEHAYRVARVEQASDWQPVRRLPKAKLLRG